MQASTLRRDFFTSLVGTVPVADLLADLPMPTHMPTPLERCVRGELPLSDESHTLLSTTEPGLCNKITKALLSVDTSFLQPKSHVSSEPYVPSQQAPPLVYSVFSKNVSGQPTLRLNRLDSSKYSSPVKNITDPLKTLATSNLPPGPPTATTIKQEESWKDSKLVKKRSSSHRLSRTDSADKPRKKQSSRRPAASGSMMVSIDRSKLKNRQTLTSDLAMRPGKKRVKKKKGEMMIRVERTKIAGAMGIKTKPPLPHSDSFTMMTAPPPSQPIEPRRPVKKKKRRQSHHGDPARIAAIQHYSFVVESLLDTEDQLSDDNLLSRSSVVHVVAETCKLKQLAVLHEISVESLVRLIAIMDKHVLDSAELQMNTSPDEGEGDVRSWREIIRERILRSLDAALAILHINTAPNMPKNVHQEESLEQLIAVTKFHLENNIYPEFDPVYRAGTKEGGALPRQKRRQGGSHSASRDVQAVYRKLTEVVENLALLLETQPLTDTTVLQISSLGTFPFFVENISSLQLSSLRLVRAVFSRYEKHRELILEDIFASLARLPTTKRNLRSFKLSNGSSVQMVSALILQLVQCIVSPADDTTLPSLSRPDTPPDPSSDSPPKADPDVQMINSYELALTTGKTFLSTFMKKCCGGKEEDDFRPLFDNFVQDLLTTLNLPEWPASEVLLTLLGVLLVHSFSNRSNEHSLRVTALDHLGVIAARLRRDAAHSIESEHEDLVSILAQVMQGRLERKTPSPTMLLQMDAFSENSKHLQKALIAYLHKRSETDPSCAYSRDFYLGQWLRDTQLELEKAMKDTGEEMDPITTDRNGDVPAISSSAAALQQAELKKEILHSLIGPKNQSELKHLEGVLDDKSAALVARYLASSRALSRSFDVYLQQLIRVLSEPEVRMRTRAMKALSCIIDSDPSILSRPDMQRAVQCRFMDQSTLVREAAVDLLGRSVLSRPELTAQYYDMLSERILDTGVSVRKRVIKILKDVCVLQPQFPKTSEICVKIMRRISDEEGIKQLVSSVFRELWFTMPPTGAAQRESLERRVGQITAVVASCKEYEWFEQLLQQLTKTDDKSGVKLVLDVCQMMVDCLVESLLTLDETSATATGQGGSQNSSRLVTCVTTLYLFCKTRPQLLLRHATTLHPYLSSKCSSQGDMMVLHYVAQILRQVVPLMEHPSESFLASLEEDLIKLVMKHGQMIVQSCIHCLGAVVNNVTHNYPLVKDCFQKFYMLLERVKTMHCQNSQNPQLKTLRPSLLRSTFTVGLLCKHFDVDSFLPSSSKENPVSGRVFSQLVYFSRHEDEEVQLKAVTGLGFFCVRHPEMMLEQATRDLYLEWLASQATSKKKCQVLKNLQSHLKEVETTLKVADMQGPDKQEDRENLLEFGDQQSNVSSSIAQAFLSAILESFLDTELQVRLGAVQVLLLIIRQGLVHPEQCIPYLITISTDPESSIRIKANQHLSEHSSRYGHFVQTTLMAGVKKSYTFHRLLLGEGARGFMEVGSSLTALLAHLYSLLRSNKQHRRAFLRALLRYFEDFERNPLGMLLYVADNMAYCPYSTVEEPLFVVHNIDMTISVSGSNILQSFREALGGTGTVPTGEEEEEEDIAQLSQRGCDLSQLADCCRSSHACFLLLLLKQHLKRMYGLTDSKCQQYSPTESNKAYDKAVNRRAGVTFDPRSVLEELKRGPQAPPRSKDYYLQQYVEFRQLMNRLDPFEEGEDSDGETRGHSTTPAPPPPSLTSTNQPPTTKEEPAVPAAQGENLLAPNANPPRGRSRSRASSSSSVVSVGSSKKNKKTTKTEPQPKQSRKRRRFFSSDSEEDDPDFTA